MSKFIDALKRTALPSVTSIGFQTKNVAQKSPQLLVVAGIVSDSKKALKTVGKNGVDAVLIRSQLKTDVTEIRKSVGDVPAGFLLASEDIESQLPSSADFIIYPVKMPVSVLITTTAGKIMLIEPSLDMGSIRAVNGIGSIVDAVMLGGDDVTLTVERLLFCQRLSDLISKPVLVSVDSSVKSSGLANLCEAGADGIVLTDAGTASVYSEIRKAIDALPVNIKRKATSTAVVPKLSVPLSADEEEQEEDE